MSLMAGLATDYDKFAEVWPGPWRNRPNPSRRRTFALVDRALLAYH